MIRQNNIIPNFIFLLFGFFVSYFFFNETKPGPIRKIYILDTLLIRDTVYVKRVKASYYNPSKSQCDDSPFYTADGTYLSRKTKNLVSLSRDLLKKYPFGSKIEILHPKKLKGIYHVHDCMHKRFRNKIDFFTFGTINVRSVLIKCN